MRFLLTALICLATAGCATTGAASFSDNPNHPAQLVGNRFLVDRVTVGGAVEQLLLVTSHGSDGRMRVRFSSERVSIEGCNWWGFEPWSVEDGRLVTIDNQPDGTLIGCSDAADSQDRWLVGFLRSGPALAIDADTVTVSGGDTVISLVYEGTA